jgi:uncharacterized protein (DUF2235 family)
MPRNIVVCCDGTGNEYGQDNSNVIRLYQTLRRGPDQRVAYYHPGVGTMGAKNALTAFGKAWTKFRGLAFGYGLSENIADAYECLMHAYEPGDRLFIFGFSRGAYTARALCGMLRMFGLLSPGNEALIPYAIRLFKSNDSGLLSRFRARPSKFMIAAGFKKTFCRECKPHFVGVWDTVSSVGWILDPIGLKPGRLPYTFDLDEVSIVRHAVAIDERRAFFRQNLVREQSGRDVKQVWFAGVHSDVGGGYPEGESGLSKISLRWMLQEATRAGLVVDDAMAARLLGEDPAQAKPRANAILHNSLTPVWWLGEFWPKRTKVRISPPGQEPAQFKGKARLNLFRRRFIPNGAHIHASVFERQTLLPNYAARNLPANYVVERDCVPARYPLHLEPGRRAIVGVHAREKWNDTALQLLKGETYLFEASGSWSDASIRSGPAGYSSPSVWFRLVQPLRRVPSANWFALIGCIGPRPDTAFVIGEHRELVAPADGILHCYANDLAFLYRNNSGWIKLAVTRVR